MDLKNVSVLATIIFLFPCQLWQPFQAVTQQTFTRDLNCKAIGQNMALRDRTILYVSVVTKIKDVGDFLCPLDRSYSGILSLKIANVQ